MPHIKPDQAVDALIKVIGDEDWHRFCFTEDPDAQIAFLKYLGIKDKHIERYFLFWQMASDKERAILAA